MPDITRDRYGRMQDDLTWQALVIMDAPENDDPGEVELRLRGPDWAVYRLVAILRKAAKG